MNTFNAQLISDMSAELSRLYQDWQNLLSNKTATERDFMRAKSKIKEMQASINAFRDAA